MDFYTVVLRKSGSYWVALCLENGIVGQGITKEDSIIKLKEAIDSLDEVKKTESDVHSEPLSVKELHEVLTGAGKEPISESYELRAVHA